MSNQTIETDELQEFVCESILIPPGTKRLPRDGEPDPLPARAYWFIGIATMLALVVGVALGRFVL